MSHARWLIYGAYGYTGALVVEEAVRRGHRPVLAGRNEAAVRAVATRFGLESMVFSLTDRPALEKALRDVDLVFHAAGPFAETSTPMVDACLATGTHYVDIAGEVAVFETNLARNAEAVKAGVTIMSGVGFDVVPTDCAARFVAERVPGATELEIAFAVDGGISAGTAATAVDSFPAGVLVRRNDALVEQAAGVGGMRLVLGSRTRTVVPMTWGDLATARRTTGIPTITVYLATMPGAPWLMRATIPLLRWLFRSERVRGWARRFLKAVMPTPSGNERAHTTIWARARNAEGKTAEVTLTSIGSYPFTAISGVNAVERILTGNYTGALTPAGAFGADFVLEVPGTIRTEGK